MALTRELNELVCRYDKYAELHRSAAMRDLERSVCGCAYGSAALRFKDTTFDALSHSDVLCCTPGKLGVLRSCRRIACVGAKMVFTVIALAPSLADSERRIAVTSGPTFVHSPDDCAVSLDQSGWCLQERTDLTAEFLQSMRTELAGMQARADALAKVLGADELTERMRHRQATIAAVDAGLLRRELFVARAGR